MGILTAAMRHVISAWIVNCFHLSTVIMKVLYGYMCGSEENISPLDCGLRTKAHQPCDSLRTPPAGDVCHNKS